ncbi:hypothetical protein PoB_007684400 [Plakobranchus ocellatus]|uniref:Uncharacterized protein n=1 Tax=Plakobranchus ocellatus TaxID=259542 RepID=A0AAV4E247_9GAST|nr:hypothetical protein PoB_007684400 [Plakobranchus ocellatus]
MDKIETEADFLVQSDFYGHDFNCFESGEFTSASNSTDGSKKKEESARDYLANDSEACATVPDENQIYHESQSQNEYASFSELLRDIGQESKMAVLQYSQTFGESEAYEQQACQNFTDLKAHALLLEQNINEKKKLLHVRLKEIVKVLTINNDDLS